MIAAAGLLAACAGPSPAAAPPGPDLQIMGDSFRWRGGDPLPAESTLFDGTTVRLRGARGETLGVQVLRQAEAPVRIELELPGAAAAVEAFAVGWLEVTTPSTPWMFGPSRGLGRYPDVLEPAGAPAVSAGPIAYFDVALPVDAPPGRHTGRLRIGDRELPVELFVEPTAIDLRADPLVWVFYEHREVAREHGVAADHNPVEVEWERRYAELFRAHGAYLAGDHDRKGFRARRALMDGIRYWPVWIDVSTEEALTADVQAWVEEFRGLDAIPFSIPIDEPRRLERRLQVRRIGKTIDRAGAGRPAFLLAVTDPPSAVYEDAVDVWISPSAWPGPAAARRARGERVWTYNGKPPRAGALILDTDGTAPRTWGWIAHRYGVELWYAWEGLYWSDRYNKGGPTDLMRDPITFDQRPIGERDIGNGEGVLAYPGPRPSLRLKALRRGLQDRLLVRALAACGAAAEADALVQRLIPRALGEGRGAAAWPSDEPTWERARAELLDALAARCPG